MKLTLEVDVDNDAFLETGELGRVLLVVARTIEDTEQLQHPRTTLRDINGNTVGWYVVE